MGCGIQLIGFDRNTFLLYDDELETALIFFCKLDDQKVRHERARAISIIGENVHSVRVT